MEKRTFAALVFCLLLLCLLGVTATKLFAVRLPHSGEFAILYVNHGQVLFGNRLCGNCEISASNLNRDSRRIDYLLQTPSGSQLSADMLSLRYADEKMEYVFESATAKDPGVRYSSQKWDCKRGQCGFPLILNRSTPASKAEWNVQASELCFSNGTYSRVLKNASSKMEARTEGSGCPWLAARNST